MFLDPSTIATSFQRLRHTQTTGKKGLERTSGLMYFLAFDQLVRSRGGQGPLDFDPDSELGRLHRRTFSFLFSNLVTLRNREDLQITALGGISSGRIPAEKRSSANFLTVPLTKAAQALAPRDYPHRPVPLLVLGKGAHGTTWGVGYHSNWPENLGTFLLENGSKTPFADLAMVVLRDYDFGAPTGPATAVLRAALGTKFTKALTDHWMKRIEFERIKPSFPTIQFQEEQSTALEDPSLLDCSDDDASVEAEHLKTRVTYLETLLAENGIEFEEECL